MATKTQTYDFDSAQSDLETAEYEVRWILSGRGHEMTTASRSEAELIVERCIEIVGQMHLVRAKGLLTEYETFTTVARINAARAKAWLLREQN